MKFLFLHSDAQRIGRNGMKQPHRLFLEDGTEIKGVTSIEVSKFFAFGSAEMAEMTIKVSAAQIVHINRRPTKVKR